MKYKLQWHEIYTFFAGTSALYTCFTANGYWNSLLNIKTDNSILNESLRTIVIYSSVYIALGTAVLMVLFNDVKFLRYLHFFATVFLSIPLIESFGFQDWFIHPIVALGLIYFSPQKSPVESNLAHFGFFVTFSCSVVTLFSLGAQLSSHEGIVSNLHLKVRWLSLFEYNPGIFLRFLSMNSTLISFYGVLIWIGLVLLPITFYVSFFSRFFFLLALMFWLIQKRLFDNNYLGWVLFVLPLLFFNDLEKKRKSSKS